MDNFAYFLSAALSNVDINQLLNKRTALYIAVHEGAIHVVKALLDCKKIDVNKAKADTTVTPLIHAIHKKFVDIVKILLAHDAIDVNRATSPATGGWTPLFVAAFLSKPAHLG